MKRAWLVAPCAVYLQALTSLLHISKVRGQAPKRATGLAQIPFLGFHNKGFKIKSLTQVCSHLEKPTKCKDNDKTLNEPNTRIKKKEFRQNSHGILQNHDWELND